MRMGFLAATAILIAAPALADVKAGVDAWGRGEYRQAVEEWRGPAVAGDADAQFNLGQAYKLGRGVPVDPALAQSWFRKAALQGHIQAQDNYALALFQADRKDEALPWLEKSATRGEPRTQLVLGTMLFNGDAVARDYPRAYALLTRAAAAGLPSAKTTLAQMDQYISPTDRERGTALAQRYALDATVRPSANPMQVVDLPPSRVPEPVAKGEGEPLPPTKTAAAPGKKGAKGAAKLAAAAKPPHAEAPPAKLAAAAKLLHAETALAPARATPAASSAAAGASFAPPPQVARPTASAAVHAAARPAPAAPARPAPAVAARPASSASGGKWRVQLGAFRERGNAEALWSSVHGKLGGAAPAYVAAGGVTRLQATGFASRADAQRACKASGVSCVVVAP